VNERRAASAAGKSWQKWEPRGDLQPEPRLHLSYILLFWFLCLEIGALLALAAAMAKGWL
jgi:hypothetical protein